MQSQQVQRKERLASASNASLASSCKQQGADLGPESQAAAAAGAQQASVPSNIPLRPLRPSIVHSTTTPFNNHHAQYPFSAHDQQILLDSCSFPPPDAFAIPTSGPLTGVGFVDGSLATTATTMGMPNGSCLSLDAGVVSHASPHSSVSYMDVGVLDYGLGPYGTPPQQNGFGDSPLDASMGSVGSMGSVWSSPLTSNGSPVQMSPCDDHALAMHGGQNMRKRRRTLSPARASSIANSVVQPTPVWDMLGGNRLARAANGAMIGETMMHIYHDVLEGALSCWLTEQTCPYNSIPATPPSSSSNHKKSINSSNTTNATHPQQEQFWGTFEDMRREWGPNWSNRVYQRVVKLDRTAHLLGLKRLSPTAERKVSTALNAAVMSFTAQWAQASQRSNARWQTPDDGGGQEFRPPDINHHQQNGVGGEEFDRTLQKSFWHQARQSLDECGEIDSFRVVFAEIIFGLTQKYGDDAEWAASAHHMDHAQHESVGATSEVVEEILREDTQQIWLERALRRLHVLRRRVELYERQSHTKKSGGGEKSAYDAECRKTIDLLFWLAVMFDTISSAMTERPLTVSDEDSANLTLTSATHYGGAAQMQGDVSKRWNLILAKDQQTKLTSLRWPCTTAEISQELADAAPVKVLLYRKVTRLQTLIARDMDARTLEEAMADTLMVYAHWQAIYSAIFADCLAHHSLLSSRIQSWYVCLFGHWLLATLLFAELVETIDERGMGGTSEARRRADEGTVQAIRWHTVRLVSDLARASTPVYGGVDPGAGQLDNFHHAVNEGALLTEPWTMILLRTFSKAAILLLEEGERLSDSRADRTADERGRLQRCEDCIKALWYLGRKSDMAREVANVLSLALGRTRFRMEQRHRH